MGFYFHSTLFYGLFRIGGKNQQRLISSLESAVVLRNLESRQEAGLKSLCIALLLTSFPLCSKTLKLVLLPRIFSSQKFRHLFWFEKQLKSLVLLHLKSLNCLNLKNNYGYLQQVTGAFGCFWGLFILNFDDECAQKRGVLRK